LVAEDGFAPPIFRL